MVSVVRVGPNGHLIRVLRPRVPHAGAGASGLKAAANSDSAIGRLVEEAAKRYQVDPLLVHSVIRVESNFNPAALSPKGAQGLMQLIPATAQRFGVTDPFDPKQNIDGGVRYLKYLQDRFPDDLTLSIAAYNAGEGAVTRYKTVPPYPETIGYVQKVSSRYSNLSAAKAPVAAAVVPTAPVPAAAVETASVAAAVPEQAPVNHIQRFYDSQGRVFLRTLP